MKSGLKIVLLSIVTLHFNLATAHDHHQATPTGNVVEKPIGLVAGFAPTNFVLDRSNLAFANYVDQGIAMLDVFHYIDALRSFKEAEALNPNSLLPAAGMIISHLHLESSGSAKILIQQKDAQLSKLNPTRQDLLWYDLAKALYARYTKNPAGPEMLANAYDALLAEFPNDVKVLGLASWLSGNYRRAPYEKALKIDPLSVGPAHYLTHILESSGDFQGALSFARIVADQATGSAHAQHMLGHLLPHLKKWSEANVQFEKAHRIHMQWAQDYNVHPSEDWHYSHNLNLWSVSLAGVGKIDESLELMAEGCKFDGRACIDLMEASIGVGRLDFAEQTAKGLPTEFGPYVDAYLADIELLRGTKSWAQASADLAPLGRFAQILKAIYNTRPGSPNEADVAQKVAAFIHQETMEAGFDSWGFGFFAGLRITQAANKQGLAQVKASAEQAILEVAPEFTF